MPTTMTFLAYEYHELSDEAKADVRAWLWNDNNDWQEFMYEDFVKVAECFGITVAYHEIYFETYPWRAGFNGRFELLAAAQCEKNIANYCKDELLMKLAAALATEIAQFAVVGLQHIVETGDVGAEIRGDHDGIHRVQDIEPGEEVEWTEEQKNALYVLNGIISATVRDLATWLAKQLEAEAEHCQSDQYARDTCDANEYKFHKNGRLIKRQT